MSSLAQSRLLLGQCRRQIWRCSVGCLSVRSQPEVVYISLKPLSLVAGPRSLSHTPFRHWLTKWFISVTSFYYRSLSLALSLITKLSPVTGRSWILPHSCQTQNVDNSVGCLMSSSRICFVEKSSNSNHCTVHAVLMFIWK